jgi:hypothetical protein
MNNYATSVRSAQRCSEWTSLGLKMQFLTLEKSLETHAAEKFLPVKQWRYASHGLAFSD